MAKITKEAALLYHSQGKPGKIEVVPTKPYSTQTDLSLAYSPGVAEPCLEIEKNPQDAYKYTAKGNLVAVISNGTAVLGLGDIGALSGKPVMEGKGLLFKIYAGIDVFDIEVNEKDPEKFIEAVKAIAPTFGGINLEDIKAPECFEIERRLKEELDIPVMHDDQHGTAIISSAGLVNALQVAGKKIEDVKIVVNGAGASAVSCTKLYVSLGARLENIVMLDSKGVISKARTDLNEQKRYFATGRTDIHTLEEAIKGADVFLGLSKGNVLSQDMVRSMAPSPIVFALANPTPEISYEDAMSARPDVLMATKRLGQLRGDPGAALKLHEHIAVFRRAAADVGTGRRPAADRHRDARAQAEMACRFFGQMAGNLTAGMDRGEFVRVEIDGTEKVPVVGAAAEADECAVGGVGKVGRVEIAGQAVDKIVLGLENFIGLFVKLRLFMAEPDALAERVLGDEHIARLAVEIVAAKAFLQRFGPLRGPAVAVNHGALERLSVAIHRQAAPHVAADANGVDALDIFGHKLAQHQHRAHGAHPPVRSVLLHHAAGTAAGGIGGGDVAQNIQILVHQRSLQPAGANVKYQ